MSEPHTPRSPSAVANDAATSITAYLIAGPVVYGGLGYAADHWLHTNVFTAVGVLLGTALALYIVYVRYGKTAPSASEWSVPDIPESTMNKETP